MSEPPPTDATQEIPATGLEPPAGVPPEVEASPRTSRAGAGRGLWAVALLALGVVVLQVTILPFLRMADGIPDLVVVMVVAVGLLRGPLVGAVTGCLSGLAVELLAPIDTLGVLALLYLIVGAVAGRFCAWRDAPRLRDQLAMVLAAALFVQLGYAVVQVLLGKSAGGPASFVGSLLIPTLVMTALLTPPVLIAARKLLGEPRIVEPFAVAP